MKTIVGVYSQLPWGSEEELYEKLVHNLLKPLLTKVYQNPEYRLVMRLGLNEFEYMDLKHPEMMMLINDLCRKNQIENLSSCGYDSVLSLVPVHERSFHLETTITYLRKKFSKKTKGLWLYNQCFTPSLLSTMDNCGLEYLLISNYSQLTSSVIETKPFCMDELGKKIIVFPTDDKFSKEIAEFSNYQDISLLCSNIEKLVGSMPNSMNTIMLNLDQLLGNQQSSQVFEVLFSNIGKNTTLPSLYLNENEINRSGYLPAGLYGRDCSYQKIYSINQKIISNPALYCRFSLLNMLRDAFKNLKKNTDERNRIENLLYKCSNCAVFFQDTIYNSPVRIHLDNLLNQTEWALNELNLIGESYCLDSDRLKEHIGFQKNYIFYLNQKGGSISRLNSNIGKWNIASENGLFTDTLKSNQNIKGIDLSSRKYEITALDKKRQDFIAKCPTFEILKKQINLTKHYKLRQNTLVVDIEIENLSEDDIKDYQYETELNLALPFPAKQETSFTSDSVYLKNKEYDFSLSLYFNEDLSVTCKDIYQSLYTACEEKSYYQYTQLKIQKNIFIQAQGVSHTVISLKFDKKK